MGPSGVHTFPILHTSMVWFSFIVDTNVLQILSHKTKSETIFTFIC
jgi:hypothetical protein